MPPAPPPVAAPAPPPRRRMVAAGLALFAFVPLVLFLFVGHPEPVGLSLAAGVTLMLGHRFLARPYLRWVLPWRCLWCGRVPARGAGDDGGPGVRLAVVAAAGELPARCCPGHRRPAARFLAFVDAWRWPLRLGIFVPLLLLLATLAADASGLAAPVAAATDLFRLVVGLTVETAALGALWAAPRERPVLPFPAHNFWLLGVRPLLWVFRLVGAWWIWTGVRGLVG